MKKIVVDTSVIVKWLNRQNEERIAQADKILTDVQNNEVILYAPDLAKYEIGNVLLLKKRLSDADFKLVFNKLFVLPIEFSSLTNQMSNQAYRIAKELGITFYDASFIALAIQENAELVTDNPKHQARTKTIKVKSLEDY